MKNSIILKACMGLSILSTGVTATSSLANSQVESEDENYAYATLSATSSAAIFESIPGGHPINNRVGSGTYKNIFTLINSNNGEDKVKLKLSCHKYVGSGFGSAPSCSLSSKTDNSTTHYGNEVGGQEFLKMLLQVKSLNSLGHGSWQINHQVSKEIFHNMAQDATYIETPGGGGRTISFSTGNIVKQSFLINSGMLYKIDCGYQAGLRTDYKTCNLSKSPKEMQENLPFYSQKIDIADFVLLFKLAAL